MELVLVIAILAVLAGMILSRVDNAREDAEMVAARATMKTLSEAFTGSPAGPAYLEDMKYVPGFRTVNIRVHDLLFEPTAPGLLYDVNTKRGWRGPYLRNAQGVTNMNPARNRRFPASGERRTNDDATFLERGFFLDASNSAYGIPDDLTVADPWGNPIVLQVPSTSAFVGSTGDAKVFKYSRLVSAGPDGVLSTPRDHRLAGMLTDGTTTARGDDLVVFLVRTDSYQDEEP